MIRLSSRNACCPWALIALGVTLLTSTSFCEILIPASDPQINYYGRFDFSTAGQARFNWTGSTIEAAFTGTSIGVSLQDNNFNYNVEVDGTPEPVLATTTNQHYTLRTDLTSGNHVIRISQRNENNWNMAAFKGFYLADGAALLPAPAKPVRKIEVIGDSWISGDGVEGPNTSCGTTDRAYSNTARSFGALTAKAFHAQSVILGYANEGLVRNYNGPKRSTTPFPYYYTRTLSTSATAWDFSRWVADVAVIALGRMDFYNTPYPDDTAFIADYHKLIATIRQNYAGVKIICMAPLNATAVDDVRQVVDNERNTLGHTDVFFAQYPSGMALNACDWHPNVFDQQAIANALIPVVTTATGWDTSSTTAAVPPARATARPSATRITNAQWYDLRGTRLSAAPANHGVRVQSGRLQKNTILSVR